ncbi:unannotated protein [freshwater metagenome]|uniref:Unannotated protein n=1 Tax=freshwater metagenome TaxID=449393 RepID=A0A6J6ZCL5_9ZZZZ
MECTFDTEILLGALFTKVTNAPDPFDACQRRASAGALTTPTTTLSAPSELLSTNPIRVAHVGTPRMKFLVPSIGSITQ